MKAQLSLTVIVALALGGCQAERPGVLPSPTSFYICEDGTRLAVRMLGDTARVAVNGRRAVSLPVSGPEGTTYSNGRQTLRIVQGDVSWAMGRAAASPCRIR